MLLNPNITFSRVASMPTPKASPHRWRIKLYDGQPHAHSIVTALDRIADDRGRTKPQVRQFLTNVVLKSRRDNDILAHIHTILQFVKDNMTYLPDPEGSEFVTDPIRYMQLIAAGQRPYGDCDDHVLVLASLLIAAGIKARVAAVRLKPNDTLYNHVIVVIPLNGAWMQLDPCAKSGQNPQYGDLLVAP